MKYNKLSEWEEFKKLYETTKNDTILQNIKCLEKNYIPKGTEVTNIKIIAGYGSDNVLRKSKYLSERYGGDSNLWEKKVGKITSDLFEFDMH